MLLFHSHFSLIRNVLSSLSVKVKRHVCDTHDDCGCVHSHFFWLLVNFNDAYYGGIVIKTIKCHNFQVQGDFLT